MDDYVIFATWKVEEIKVPLGIGIHASHCSTAVLQFDQDPATGSIAFENSKLSDYPAECLQLRVEGTGQEQSERSEEKRTESADHGLHCKKKKGPFSGYKNRPRKAIRLEAEPQPELHHARANRTTGFAEERSTDLVIRPAARTSQFEVGTVEHVEG